MEEEEEEMEFGSIRGCGGGGSVGWVDGGGCHGLTVVHFDCLEKGRGEGE